MKEKINKLNVFLIITLLVVMPILDLNFFYSRITTLAETFIILICLAITAINNTNKKRGLKYIIIYYLLCLLYLMINYLRSFNFNSFFPNNFNYSLYRESLVIIKLMMPISFYYILKNTIKNEKIFKYIIIYWSIFISGIIIISDIFKIGYSSYSNEIISYNIFEWKKNVYYVFTACKGYFNYGNQEACILLMLLLVNIYYYLYKNNNNLIIIIMLSLSMIILGTRTSTIGGLLLLIFMYCFHYIYKKTHINVVSRKHLFLLIPIFIWLALLPISPFFNRNIELTKKRHTNYIQNEKIRYESAKGSNDITEIKKQKLIDYFDKMVDNSVLPEMFYKNYYSYQNDPEFWVSYIKNNNINGINYRKTEISIINRIMEVNNNKFDYLFGIGNSRIQNVVNIERDFILQFYAYGIIGELILLSPYVYLIYLLIKKIKREKHIKYIILFGVYVLFIISSYLTGNILNYLTCTIPMIFIYNGINNEDCS